MNFNLTAGVFGIFVAINIDSPFLYLVGLICLILEVNFLELELIEKGENR